MSVKINDRVFGANVDPETIKEFDKLAGGGLKQSKNPLGPAEPAFEKYLGDRTTFARMWTAVITSGSGIQYKDQETFYYSINDNKSDNIDYEPNQPISSTNLSNELTGDGNYLLKPKAGITSITSTTQGTLGAIKKTSIDFVVHNKKDFDNIFLPFFLRPGCTLVLDYGWSDVDIKLYNIQEQLRNHDTEMTTFKNFIYGGIFEGPNGEQISTNSSGKRYFIPQGTKNASFIDDKKMPKNPGFIEKNKGKVDTLIGIVTSYNSKINQQGSFECNVEIVSENTTLLDFEIDDDNKLKYIFANKIEEILVQILTGNSELATFSSLQDFDNFSSDEKIKYLNTFFENTQKFSSGAYENKKKKIGIIPPSSVKFGIYFEGVTDVAGIKRPNKDALYITWGLLEDLFLNTFISENVEKNKFDINFKNQNSFVRFDQILYNRQVADFYSSDTLPTFVYPLDWSNSRDGINEDFENQKNGNNIYKTSVIPLRDLFISVKLISKAFSAKQNVNEAIESILDSINQDSFDIFKLKMFSPNASNSSISIQDANLLPPIVEKKQDLLTFDVTSELSIVNGLDYSFQTPKGGLQNMIAISNSSQDKIFDIAKKDNLNFLNLLKSDKYANKKNVFLRSLPLNKKTSKGKEKTVSFDFNSKSIKTYKESFDKGQNIGIAAAVRELSKKQTDYKETLEKKQGTGKKNVTTSPDTTDENGRVILFADSERDKFGKQANLNTVLSSKDDSISTIMPINLSLSVYGNTFLNVGDVFTVNFLPDSYRDKIYFQITNISQKVDSNWQTTYSTVMRVRPTSKKQIVDTTVHVIKSSNPMLREELSRYKNTDNLKRVIDSSKAIRSSDDNNFEIYECELDYSRLTKDLNKNASDQRALINVLPPIKSLQDAQVAYVLTETLVTFESYSQKKGLYDKEDMTSGTTDLINYVPGIFGNKDQDYLFRFGFQTKNIQRIGQFSNYGLLRYILTDNMTHAFPKDKHKLIYGGNISDKRENRPYTLNDEAENGQQPGGLAATISKRKIFKDLIEEFSSLTSRKNILMNINENDLDSRFAPIGRQFFFKAGDYKQKDKQTVYIIRPNIHGVSSEFLDSIKIPKWFLGDQSIDRFCETFYNIHSSYSEKVIEYTGDAMTTSMPLEID